MQRPQPADDDDEKLIPEWGVAANDQIIWLGLAVFVAMALIFGWNSWRGGSDDESVAVATSTAITKNQAPGAKSAAVPAVPVTAPATSAPATSAPATTAPATTQTPSTTAVVPAANIGDVQASVSALPGSIVGTNDGTTAILTGFVFNEAERTEAANAAGLVTGIESVDNQLQRLDQSVLASLAESGVVTAAVAGPGTVVTVSGVVQSEDARAATIAAAAGVEGVTEVVDELTLSVAANLNNLPQVQFATSSADILPESFADLDAAAELIKAGGEVELEIQGYTDTRGPAAANLALSQDRADAVRQYLIDAGVDELALTSTGYGETDQFATGDTDEALLANRVVLFEQVG